MTTLAERFAQDEGQPQEVDGLTVENIYRREVEPGQVVRICRVSASASPVQGLRVKVDKGKIAVGGTELDDVVLWADTSPPEVQVVCNPRSKKSGELRVWNCWRDDAGVMQAWVGDAGTVIERSSGHARIRCGDGTHLFDPSDLEVVLTFE